MAPHPRPYVEHAPGPEQTVPLDRDQAHCHFGVMRRAAGDAGGIVNRRDGAREARVAQADRRGAILDCTARVALRRVPCDPWRPFAPIGKARADTAAAAALGLWQSAPGDWR